MIRPTKVTGLSAGAVFIAALALGAGSAMAEGAGQAAPDSQSQPGETLTERLGRTDGVIKPPEVDAPMQIEPPEGMTRTPVIKPPIEQQTPQDSPAGPTVAPPASSPDQKPDGPT